MIHVMIYNEDDNCIEARGENIQKVRCTSGKELFGKPFTTIKSGEQCGNYIVYFGTYFEKEKQTP